MDDPFSDEARLLIEKVASIRTTAEELFHLRSEKIVSLAQSQADGSYIEREELRMLIPAELEMFNRIVDGVRACRASLIEWRVGAARGPSPMKVEIPERLNESSTKSRDEYAAVERESDEYPTESPVSLIQDGGLEGDLESADRAYDLKRAGHHPMMRVMSSFRILSFAFWQIWSHLWRR